MPGTISRFNLPQGSTVTVPSTGLEVHVAFTLGFGSADIVYYVRDPWDDCFTQVADVPEAGSEEPLVHQILNSGNLWDTGNPTWRELEAGATYVSSSDGLPYTGTYAVEQRFVDWLINNTVATCQTATDIQWFHGSVLKEIQTNVDYITTTHVIPPKPVPVDPTLAWPPQQKGLIARALGLWQAQGSRLKLTIDPNNSSRVLVGAIPVSQ